MSNPAKIALVIIIALALGGGIFLLRFADDPVKKINETAAAKDMKNALLPEELRRAYVEKHIALHDLVIDGDVDPDGKPVPGLLRVHGDVENTGDERVNKVVLVLHLQDETNDVLGSYTEDICGGKVLGPGERRSFKFKVPEKKGFDGRFIKSLR